MSKIETLPSKHEQMVEGRDGAPSQWEWDQKKHHKDSIWDRSSRLGNISTGRYGRRSSGSQDIMVLRVGGKRMCERLKGHHSTAQEPISMHAWRQCQLPAVDNSSGWVGAGTVEKDGEKKRVWGRARQGEKTLEISSTYSKLWPTPAGSGCCCMW